ncbi:MAG TPA: metallophosphoesterase family protein [Candidatus Binatia bacterium]|nr:metallophosphoesterase family protein [Candidatus Binatia bacterium]
MRTLVHLSDLHFGRTDARLLEPLLSTVQEIGPDLVVISGDLTQRARRSQFREARAFLDRLPQPQIVVPGNHDVPLYDVLRRALRPLARYRRYITDELAPWYADEEIAIAGINTARSLTFKGGRINARQIEALRRRLCPLPPKVVRIVVSHHPFDLPGDGDTRDLVRRAPLAMQMFASCGADVLLSGHLHTGRVGDTAKRYPLGGYSAIVVQAGTATSTRVRGEGNSFNVVRVEPGRLTVTSRGWSEAAAGFVAGPEQAFSLKQRA